jgi:hypothetical protein
MRGKGLVVHDSVITTTLPFSTVSTNWMHKKEETNTELCQTYAALDDGKITALGKCSRRGGLSLVTTGCR